MKIGIVLFKYWKRRHHFDNYHLLTVMVAMMMVIFMNMVYGWLIISFR